MGVKTGYLLVERHGVIDISKVDLDDQALLDVLYGYCRFLVPSIVADKADALSEPECKALMRVVAPSDYTPKKEKSIVDIFTGFTVELSLLSILKQKAAMQDSLC